MEIFSYTLKNIFSKYGKKYFLNNETLKYSNQLTALIFFPKIFPSFYFPKKFSFYSNYEKIFFINDGSKIKIYENKISELKDLFSNVSSKFVSYLDKISNLRFSETADFFFDENLFLKNIFPSLNFTKFFTTFYTSPTVSKKIFYRDLFFPSVETLVVNNPELFYTVFPPSVIIFVENFLRKKFYELIFENRARVVELSRKISENFIKYIKNGDYGKFNFEVNKIVQKLILEKNFSEKNFRGALQKYSGIFYSIFISCVLDKFLQFKFWDENFEKEEKFFSEIFKTNIYEHSEYIASFTEKLFTRYKNSPEILYPILKYTIYYYAKQNALGPQVYKIAISENNYQGLNLSSFDLRNYFDFILSLEKTYDSNNFFEKLKNALTNGLVEFVLSTPEFITNINYFGALDKIIDRIYYAQTSNFVSDEVAEGLNALLNSFTSYLTIPQTTKINYHIEIGKYYVETLLLPVVWILHRVVLALRDL